MTPIERAALALKVVDDWASSQLAKVSDKIGPDIKLGDPAYHELLGEHRAFMRLRSFIHGTRKQSPTLALREAE